MQARSLHKKGGGMSKVMSARDAVEMISTGDTVAIGGLISLVTPEAVICALGDRFRETGSPGNLTLMTPNRPGWTPGTGMDHLGQPGMLRRVYGATFNRGDSPAFVSMAEKGEIEIYSYPMGCLYRLIRETAAGSPGFFTQVGLNTYVDPEAINAGSPASNSATPPSTLVRRIELDGEPYLFYKAFPIHAAIIRGTVADPDGNISLAQEPVSIAVKAMAMAARNSGGKVIAQVKYLTDRGTLHPRMVEVPGMLVDAVVVDPQSIQSRLGDYDPLLSGEYRNRKIDYPFLEFDERKIIARRALLEMKPNQVVNLGVGIGTGIPPVALEEGVIDKIIFSLEHGAIGGVPAIGTMNNSGAFGAHYNPTSIIDSTEIFDFYHGGGLDLTVLGFAEVDKEGNVNVGHFSGMIRGPGGFLDIAHRTKIILFCGTLTAGGLKIDIKDSSEPSIHILQEGRSKKFIDHVSQINFHGPTAFAKGQKVLYITERGVFQLQKSGLELIEIAPGIDLDRDIKQVVAFSFSVSPQLSIMNPKIFNAAKLNLDSAPPWKN
jgi:acyl CoA:acetate/3-ketoacid CoA transferase